MWPWMRPLHLCCCLTWQRIGVTQFLWQRRPASVSDPRHLLPVLDWISAPNCCSSHPLTSKKSKIYHHRTLPYFDPTFLQWLSWVRVLQVPLWQFFWGWDSNTGNVMRTNVNARGEKFLSETIVKTFYMYVSFETWSCCHPNSEWPSPPPPTWDRSVSK